MELIKRSFISELESRMKQRHSLIQIILGPRQVGKTTGILQFLKNYKKAYHLSNADDFLAPPRQWLLEQWQAALLKGNDTLLVIDEVQKITNWAETIKKLWDQQLVSGTKIKLILLGSGALSINKGMTESLAGRFELIPVYHWDYPESNKLKPMDIETYLIHGGYPGSYKFLDDRERWERYLRNSIIDPVIDKDILRFSMVKKPALFRQSFEILSCYPSQEISYRKLLGQIQDRGNVDQIKYYISLFENAFLIKALYKYGSQSFKVKSSSPKILHMAPCFYTIFSNSNEKLPFIFESTVGAKLLQLSPSLFYWRENNNEVDFVFQWNKKIFAIEVKLNEQTAGNGMEVFLKKYPNAYPIIISFNNYEKFIKDPKKFLNLLSA